MGIQRVFSIINFIVYVVFREHDIIVVNSDGSTENITKFPFGPDHNVIV